MYFVNSWEKRNSAWSGTPQGLYHALLKKVDVSEINPVGHMGAVATIGCKLLMGLPSLYQIQKKINENETINTGTPLLCFGEYHTKAVADSYCYQDLSVDYLFRLRKSKSPVADWALDKRIMTAFVKKKNEMARQFYEDCAGVFTMSSWLREDLIKHTGLPKNKVHCVGGGCSIDVSRIDLSQKQGNRFLFVGKDWERKNGALVVHAFNLLKKRQEGRNLELYIVGPQRQPAEAVGEGIYYLGRLTHEQLVDVYNRCDYYVMPSQFEAYGLVFAEALCFGLPCIGKRICAMPEFIQDGENGYLINGDDAEELANAMGKVLCDDKIVRNVQAKRDWYIDTYSWDSVVDRILKIMRNDGYSLKNDTATLLR